MRAKLPCFRGFSGRIETAPASACNTRRGLTRSSDISREGLAVMLPKTCSIPEFPGYEISTDGRVYSTLNWRGYGRREIQPVPGAGGYAKVRLRHPDGRRVNRSVHRLVALTFMSPRPSGEQLRHLNGNKLDNRLDNFSWGTPLENAQDRDEHGTTARGRRNGFAKLTESDIPIIRRKLAGGSSQRNVAKQFGVTQSAIFHINKGRTWRHVA